MERLNRGIALERITEVTKISQRHLVALEENQFRVLPGGILNKGIVRGYVNVLGLDEMDWITRFQRAYAASGELLDDDRNWIEFAANVGRARVRPRDAATERLKWAGASAAADRRPRGLFRGPLLRLPLRLVAHDRSRPRSRSPAP
jgi:cytoskeleton protein RodZ